MEMGIHPNEWQHLYTYLCPPGTREKHQREEREAAEKRAAEKEAKENAAAEAKARKLALAEKQKLEQQMQKNSGSDEVGVEKPRAAMARPYVAPDEQYCVNEKTADEKAADEKDKAV